MSRGYGRRERAILEAIQSKGAWFYLRDLLPAHYNKGAYNALNRAALKLARAGRIGCVYWPFGDCKKTAIGPAGSYCDRKCLSVGEVTK